MVGNPESDKLPAFINQGIINVNWAGGDIVGGFQKKQQAGGDIVEGSKVQAGRDAKIQGPIGRDIGQHILPGRSAKETAALGFLILCIATAIAGLAAIGGLLAGLLDRKTGLELVGGLLGTAGLSGLLRILLKR